jgi:hypothetical protein
MILFYLMFDFWPLRPYWRRFISIFVIMRTVGSNLGYSRKGVPLTATPLGVQLFWVFGISDNVLVSISMHKCVGWVYLSNDFD